MANENQRSTIGIWLNSKKYKRFALACKRFGFRISEILEDMMDEFVARYPPEDPNQIQFIQAPMYVAKPLVGSPDVRAEYQKGLLKWLNVFKCPNPDCDGIKHVSKENMSLFEERGIVPSCPKCWSPMVLFERAEEEQ